MNLLQPILISTPPPFWLRTGLIFSTLLWTASFADNTKHTDNGRTGVAPPSLTSSGHAVKNTTTAIPSMVFPLQYPQTQAPRYYYSPPQQQYYQALPYGYYPQQPSSSPYYYPYPVTASYPSPPVINTISNNRSTAGYPMRKKITKKKYAWGDERHIWPDFYTDFTGDAWDNMLNAPYKAGRMPGGWRAPSLSTPDPVTVSDAITNQLPPIMEEMGNMTNFSN
jgi:hypothetical protein